jgi:hypothetical protein
MRSKILSLPIEVTEHIGSVRFTSGNAHADLHLTLHPQHLSRRDLKTLRLVCSQFNRTFESEVLATLVISITRNTLNLSTRQLKGLAWRKTRVAQLARTLKIKSLSPQTSQAIYTSPEARYRDSSMNLSLAAAISLGRKFR